jgi:predicted unusual protein kinase regulating ubiquinone biosynthesis (AarF/ABC1/UbiB family)
MAKKQSTLNRSSLGRSLSVSLAGIRAGGAFAIDGALQRLRGDRDADALDSAFARKEARRFVAELGRLKGTYVKIGQMLAMLGEHFLPPVLTDALHELESQTEALPWVTIEPALREALGDRMDELEIDKRAFAAASLAQVHRATIRDSGESICLKIQYPGLAEVIDSDFDTVVRMLLLSRWVKAGRDLDAWLEDMRTQLHYEIDYHREAAMGDRVAELLAGSEAELMEQDIALCVPKRYPHYCSATVLAFDYIDGHLATQAEVANLPQKRRDQLGRAMLELFFYELYHWGVLQTDPNFGNYLVRSRGSKDELVLLDFGSVLIPEQDFLLHLGNVIAAGQAEDRDGITDGLIGLGCLQPDASDEGRALFADFCMHLLEPLRDPASLPAEYLNSKGEYCWAKSRLMRRAGKEAASSATSRHFTPPSREFAMIARKLSGVFTFIAVLRAEFNAHEIVQRHINRWSEK